MTAARRLLWGSLADERPNREYHWLSLMPDTRVTVAGGSPPSGDVDWVERAYRRPIKRFTEAAALAWMRDVETIDARYDWVASLELCSLVTAQMSSWAERTGTKQAVVLWANDPELMFYSLPPYRQAYHRARRADLFLSFIQAGYDHCLALGLPEERCAVVLPGVDTALFQPSTPPAEPVISFISPLVPKKGLRLVLEAFEHVRRVVPEAVLQVMGRGPDSTMALAAQEATGGRVRYLGSGDVRRVAEVLSGTTVFTTAPRASHRWNEQYGLAYLEAMAAGVPVVTTICGSNHEAVVPPNIRVPDDAEALAEGLVSMLVDPARRAEVSAFNRAHVVAKHDMVTQARRMGEVFTEFERRST